MPDMREPLGDSLFHAECGGRGNQDAALRSFQDRLGYFFRDRGLLHVALCHSSYAHENGLPQSNERLEFLGDAILGMLVADVLYDTYPDASEGELSAHRVSYVCRDALNRWGLELDLGSVLLRGKSLKGHPPASVFADAVEAVLGAVYLDGGFEAAERVVRRYLFGVGQEISKFEDRDAKSKLQILLQSNDWGLPRYEILSVKGPSHSPVFHVRAHAAGRSWTAEGKNRKAAELEAASAALRDLDRGAPDSAEGAAVPSGVPRDV